jgi:hypothetical protein
LAKDPIAYPEGNPAADPHVTMTVEWEGRKYTISQDDVGPADDMMCRAQTADITQGRGFTVSGMMTTLAKGFTAEAGTDVFAVLIWICRRKAGEHDLTVTDVMNALPSFRELIEKLRIEMVVDEEDEGLGGDLPEVSPTTSGPSSLNGTASTSRTSTGRRSKAASRSAS